MRKIILIINDIRSSHNVGALLRTADAMGVEKLIFSGYSPYPRIAGDTRLPHIVNKLTKSISKTALGAEDYLDLEYSSDILAKLKKLKTDGYSIISLEQSKESIDINEFLPTNKCVLVIGNELDGVAKSILNISDTIIEIPMIGKKESLNVASATAIALHLMRYKK